MECLLFGTEKYPCAKLICLSGLCKEGCCTEQADSCRSELQEDIIIDLIPGVQNILSSSPPQPLTLDVKGGGNCAILMRGGG